MKKTILNVLLASFITTNLITTITSATVLDENIEYDFNTSINSTIDELDYSSMISSAQLPTLVKELRLYIESNPNLGEEEINNYFKNLIIENYDENLMILEKNQNNLRYDYANSLPIVSSKLGPTEKQVFNSSPAKGALVLSNAQAAIDMTSQHCIFNDYEYHNDNLDILFGMPIMLMIVEQLMQKNLLMLMRKIFLMLHLKLKWICLIIHLEEQ